MMELIVLKPDLTIYEFEGARKMGIESDSAIFMQYYMLV